MNNSTEVSIKFKNTITNETKLKQYAETLSKIQSVLSGMNEGQIKQMEQSGTSLKNINNEADKIAKKMNLAFDYTIIKKFASSLSSAYQSLIRVTQKSSEFLESFNLFQVAFNGNYISAERFMNKMTEMYGLDESWTIKTIGLFKQLANAMGLTADVGERLSTLLTQMSIDISSLYNLDVDKVPAILQSALAGQTKPARRLGADITQSTLQQTLGGLGIDREVVNLSYAEKRLLIVISLTKQLTQVTGDWGRTLESPANQMRILSEQFNRFSREVGNVFLPILSKILPYMNAILMILTEIIASIARLLGYKKEDYDYFGTMAEDIDDFGAGVGEATTAVEKLKRGLRGFDKLNNITTPTSGAGGVGGGIGTGVDTALLKAFNDAYDDYFKKLDKVQMKATKIRDAVMEWLGFTKEIDPITGDVSFKYQGIDKTLKNMWQSFKKLSIQGKLLVGLGLVSGATALFKIGTKLLKLIGVSGLLTPLKTLYKSLEQINFAEVSLTKGVSQSINIWAKELTLMDRLKVSLIGAGGMYLSLKLVNDAMEDMNKNGVTLTNTFKALGGVMGSVLSGALLGSQFGMVGTIIGGVTGGVIALYDAFMKYPTAVSVADEAINESINSIDKYNASLQEQYDTIKQNAIQQESLETAYSNLVLELENITDANGKVKKGYEERAEFIITTLNQAYGLEIEMVDGIIQKYGEQIQFIKDIILEKKKQIALEGAEEAYKVALQEKVKTYQNYKDAVDANTKAIENQKTAQDNYNKAYEDWVLATGNGIKIDVVAQAKLKKRREELEKTNGTLNKSKNTLDKATKAYDSNTQAILTYEGLLSADTRENAELVKKYVNDIENSYYNGKEYIKLTQEEQLDDAALYYSSMLRLAKEKGMEINNETFAQAEARLNSLNTNLSKMTNSVKGNMGNNLIEAWRTLGETSESKFLQEFTKLDKDIQQKVVDKMQSKGYKISEELQKGINKINPTIKVDANTNNAENKIKNLGNKILNLFTFGIMGGRADGGILVNGKWQPANYYGSGGLPPVGQMFVAREAGPELVGNIGSHTAVMNNDQIVSSVAYGVEGAVTRAMRNANKGTQVFNLYLDQDHKIGTYTLEQLQEMAKSNGKPLTIGG